MATVLFPVTHGAFGNRPTMCGLRKNCSYIGLDEVGFLAPRLAKRLRSFASGFDLNVVATSDESCNNIKYWDCVSSTVSELLFLADAQIFARACILLADTCAELGEALWPPEKGGRDHRLHVTLGAPFIRRAAAAAGRPLRADCV